VARETTNGLDRVRRPTNNLHVTVPLDGSRPLTQVQPGDNSPALLPRSARDQPPANVTGPLLPQTSVNDGAGLLGGFALLDGLSPSGQPQSPFDPSFGDLPSFDGPTVGETESRPMLGGLLPDPGTPSAPAIPSAPGIPSAAGIPSAPGIPSVTDLSGLPAGGMAVLAPAISGHHKAKPAATPTAGPSSTPSIPSTTSSGPADPRLHEEPIDPSERTFSPDTRPVAGIDQQYK
jgi:hypothetical protein